MARAPPTAAAPEQAGDEVGDLRVVTDTREIVSVLAGFIVADLIQHPRLDE